MKEKEGACRNGDKEETPHEEESEVVMMLLQRHDGSHGGYRCMVR